MRIRILQKSERPRWTLQRRLGRVELRPRWSFGCIKARPPLSSHQAQKGFWKEMETWVRISQMEVDHCTVPLYCLDCKASSVILRQ